MIGIPCTLRRLPGTHPDTTDCPSLYLNYEKALKDKCLSCSVTLEGEYESKNLDLLPFRVKEYRLRKIGCKINFAVLQAAKNVTWFETPEDGDEASGCQSFCGRLPSTLRAFVSKIVWLSSTARNAVVVVACALIAYGFDPVLPSSSCQQR